MSRRASEGQDGSRGRAGAAQDQSRGGEGRGHARRSERDGGTARDTGDSQGGEERDAADSDHTRAAPASRRSADSDAAPPAADWRPVDGPDEPAPDTGWRQITDTAETPTDLLRREFLRAPEGDLREGSLVVRPSLRAALGRVGVAFLVVTAFFLPFQIGTGMQAFGDDEGEPAGFWVLAFEIASNLVIPFLVSLAPALQLAFTRYILDDEGIRERVQLLSRSDKRVRWDKVTALQHRRTFVDRILQIERVDVVAYGSRGTTLHLVGLRRAPYIRGLVARQMRAQASVSGMLRND